MANKINALKVVVAVQQTVSSSALTLAGFTGITAAQVAASSRVWLTVNTNAVRIRYDGTAPTVTVGHRFSAGNDILLPGGNLLVDFQIIRDGTADSEVFVTLEG